MQPRSPRALRSFYLSFGAFAAAALISILGSVFFDFRTADRVHCHCSLGSFIRHGGRGRSRCRVHDDVQETRLAVRSLAEEAELAAYPIDNP
jgi:hypothetical protein